MEVDLALALQMCEAALVHAANEGALVSVAVVDAGGHLIAFTRMDGAEIAGPVLARDKAYTAVAHRCATGELGEAISPGGDLVGMNSADDGRYIAFGGGLPLWSDGRVVGGVGVSGGTAAQDVAAATVALAAYTSAEASS